MGFLSLSIYLLPSSLSSSLRSGVLSLFRGLNRAARSFVYILDVVVLFVICSMEEGFEPSLD